MKNVCNFCKLIPNRSFFALAGILSLAAVAHAEAPKYDVSTAPVGGEGRWDYAIARDPATHMLYITRSSHVQVYDTVGAKLAADIPNTAGVHGVALAPTLNRGFASDGQAGQVTVFDLKTNKTLGVVKAGQNPDAIYFDAASGKVFAFNGRSKDATGFDANTELGATAKTATLPLGGKPEFAAGDGQGHVFVNIEDTSEIVDIDSKAMKVAHRWKIDGGEEPSGLAIDAAHHHLFAGCGNEKMAVIDTATGKTLATVDIGKGVDACGFDPGTGYAFASCGDSTLSVIAETQPGKFERIETVKTRPGARTMALDSSTHTVYLPAAEMLPAAGNGRPSAKPGSFMLVVVKPVNASK